MIVIEQNDYPHRIRLPNGQTDAWLTQDEWLSAHDEANDNCVPIAVVVDGLAHEERTARQEQDRRFLVAQMAMNGEFSGIARQLKIWDADPVE